MCKVCLHQTRKDIKEEWKQEDGGSSAEQNLIPGLRLYELDLLYI
jgi:hypothetical protein